jgi:hypothetical protein
MKKLEKKYVPALHNKIFSTSSIVNTFVYLYIYTSWNGINVYCSQNLSFLLITIWRLLLAYHYGSLIRPFLKKFCPFFTWHISSKCLYVQLVLHFKFEFFKTLHVSLLIYIKSLWQFNWTFLNNLIWFESKSSQLPIWQHAGKGTRHFNLIICFGFDTYRLIGR